MDEMRKKEDSPSKDSPGSDSSPDDKDKVSEKAGEQV
jgi:hypothetical protein